MNILNRPIIQVALFIVFVAFVIAAPHFLLRLPWADCGPVGDAIAGTTAPVIGVCSALLLFVSFQQQIKANKLLSDQQQLNDKIMYANQWGEYIQRQIDQVSIPSVYSGDSDFNGESCIRHLNNKMFDQMNNHLTFYNDFFEKHIPEQLSLITANIKELSAYMRQNKLLNRSFRAHQVYQWMQLFDNMFNQIVSIHQESNKNKEAPESRFKETNYKLKIQDPGHGEQLKILAYNIEELYKETKLYKEATGKDKASL
jgi:hypothetical protein